MSDWINDRPEHGGVRWRLVIPVKGGPAAKSRLQAPDGVEHPRLARALALDTVGAAMQAVGAEHVFVVTSDSPVRDAVLDAGGHVVADPSAGLNAAVTDGIDTALQPPDGAERRPDAATSVGVAVLLGDVPALRPGELRSALHAAERHDSAFVPDADGRGTVLLTYVVRSPAAAGRCLEPRFGVGSAARHEADGHVRLELALPGLRRDVDDADDLREALLLGVGRHTAKVLAHLITPPWH